MTSHPSDDLAAYAIGALDEHEQRLVAAHVASCPSCSAEVRAFAETSWALAETAARDAPPRLRAAIVDRASGAAVPRASRFLGLFDALRRPVPLFVPIALAVVLVLALVGYGTARNDAARYAAVVAGAVGARVVPLAASAAATGVRGSLVIPANGAAAYLILDLPAPAAGTTWEAWVIHGDTPMRAGVTNDHGVTTLTLTTGVAAGDTVAITSERAGGVDAPTGTPVLAGKS